MFPYLERICQIKEKQVHGNSSINSEENTVFFFSAVNQAEQSYSAFTKKLKSTHIE